jgi:hypothetical protein
MKGPEGENLMVLLQVVQILGAQKRMLPPSQKTKRMRAKM